VTEHLIADLEQIQKNLQNYLAVIRQPHNRPADPYPARFCRDWYAWAMQRRKPPRIPDLSG